MKFKRTVLSLAVTGLFASANAFADTSTPFTSLKPSVIALQMVAHIHRP